MNPYLFAVLIYLAVLLLTVFAAVATRAGRDRAPREQRYPSGPPADRGAP